VAAARARRKARRQHTMRHMLWMCSADLQHDGRQPEVRQPTNQLNSGATGHARTAG
jgi:hypothetical protein